MSRASAVANRTYLAAATPALLRLRRALRNPQRAQLSRLRSVVSATRDSAFGRAHDLAALGDDPDPVAFRVSVPARDFDDLRPWVDRIEAGEDNVLTSEGVRFLEPTGGSAGASKLVPYTSGLLNEFSAATMAWTCDLLRSRPGLRGGRAYWSVSPPARQATHTGGGVPIGMEHDSDYFPAFARRLIDAALGVPRALSQVTDVDSCRYVTLRALLAMDDLAMASVWNPSFLTLLFDVLDQRWEELLVDLESGSLRDLPGVPAGLRGELQRALPRHPARARQLVRDHPSGVPSDLGRVWPRLGLVSCWTDAHAARALPALQRRLPGVELQGKGLLATEGVVSIPLHAAPAPVLAVTSHFLEFVPVEDPLAPNSNFDPHAATLLAHELEVGAHYEVLLSTSGGLVRYRIKDIVRVEGRLHATPTVRFVGRADRASDIAGEKLTPAFVDTVLDRALGEAGMPVRFAMLAPELGDPPQYTLFLEPATEPGTDALQQVGARVEALLREAHHYDLCRDLGQLGAIQAVRVRDGEAGWELECRRRGQRAGNIKPATLDTDVDWRERLGLAGGSRPDGAGGLRPGTEVGSRPSATKEARR